MVKSVLRKIGSIVDQLYGEHGLVECQIDASGKLGRRAGGVSQI